MPEEVIYDERSQLIRVRAWGRDTIQDWESSKAKVMKLYACHGCRRLLVDTCEQESAPGTIEIFDFGTNWPSDIRCAIVVGERTHDQQQFLETVACNRGLPIKVFASDNEALQWLHKWPNKPSEAKSQ